MLLKCKPGRSWMTAETWTPCGSIKRTLDEKIKMNYLKVRNIYLLIYKEIVLLIKTCGELWRWIQIKKKSFIATDKKITNIPQGNRITLEKDMKAVKIHECLKCRARLRASFWKQKWRVELSLQHRANWSYLKAHNGPLRLSFSLLNWNPSRFLQPPVFVLLPHKTSRDFSQLFSSN